MPNSQCGNCKILLPLRFYVKSILDILQSLKNAISTILAALYFKFLVIFDNFICEMFQKSKLKASKIVKMTVFDQISQIWFHIKSKFEGNCKISTLFVSDFRRRIRNYQQVSKSTIVFCLVFHLIYQFRS